MIILYSKVMLFVDLFCICLCHTAMSVSCNLVVTCCENAVFLVLLYVMFSYVFVTFPYSVLGQVWYLIVSIPDLCLLSYFKFSCLLFVNSMQAKNAHVNDKGLSFKFIK